MKESIAFIICYDDEKYLEECIYYINKLQIPKEFDVDIFSISDVSCLAEGYNAAMKESNAKYKVYLDSHTFIINDAFLYEMISLFKDNPKIGMFGLCGSSNGAEEVDRGRIIIWDDDNVNELNMQKSTSVERVCTVNNMLIATQYDMPWEDECGVTHSQLLWENGYEVVVPYQADSWCLYDCGKAGLSSIEEEYRFHLRRVDIYHDIESATFAEKLLMDGIIKYEEHIAKAELMSCSPNIIGYFWEDFLLGGRKRNKYLPANGAVHTEKIHENVMHVVAAFNHKYVVYAAVMLQSLYENNSLCDICVHVLQCELTKEDKQLLSKQATLFGNKVEFHTFNKDWLPTEIDVTEEWSIEAYFRLYMIDLLPQHVDRILYLDVDVIVNKSIYDYYFMDMQDYDIVGCRDFSRVLNEEFEDKRKELFAGIKQEKEFVYFNSGVMLVNIDKLRKRMKGSDYLKVIKEYQGRVLAPDQDILNLVHWKSVGLVDEYRYDFFNACLKGVQPEEVKRTVSMIHFAGPKPWMPIDIRIHAHKIWWEYAVRTSGISDFLYQTIVQDKNVVTELKAGLERAKYCMHVPFMSCDVEGIKYIGSSLDLTIMRRMYNTRENWSKKEINAFFELAEKYYGISGSQESGIFMDIGGNIGTTSIYVKKVKAPSMKVIAFEPMTDNIRMFKANCILNDIDDSQIILVEKALSNKCVTNVMEKNMFNPGMSHVVEGEKIGNANTEVVESITLDEYLNQNKIEHSEIKYIWIDVEGVEGFVIDGARSLLKDSSIPVLMEFVPKYLKRQNSYQLLLENLEKIYTHFIWLDEYMENGRCEMRNVMELEEFALQLGDGQADIFLIKRKE